MTIMRFESQGLPLHADLAQPLSLAIPMDFDGAQPQFLGAGRAHAAPLRIPGFTGDTRQGGSCNCEEIRLVAHCNGTHTECVGHLTSERVFVADTLRGGLFLAQVVTVRPVPAGDCGDDPVLPADDLVICAAALQEALDADTRLAPRAVVIRTLPNGADKITRHYQGEAPAPYMTAAAAKLLASREVEHLVLDTPSADRAHDQGRLAAHRAFFGLPLSSRRAADATRPQATITELAYVAPMIHDGWYLLDLQIPAFLCDAAPSRPLLYPVRFD